MIVCASRRTDIPAFHSEWLMNRLREGYCLARNPVSRNVVHHINLRPENVDMLIMMTKNPAPMIRHIEEMNEIGIKFCFQVTITPYGEDIEPEVPGADDVIASFKEISDMIGKERMIWRYDPIILNDEIDIEYHKVRFTEMSNELRMYADRCTFSFLDVHKKLEPLVENNVLRRIGIKDMENIAKMISEVSRGSDMIVNFCGSGTDVRIPGISSGACIDREYMKSLGVPSEESPVPIRPGCKCVRNVDIGDYDTCMHDCIYCYANKAERTGRSKKQYDSNSKMLFGELSDEDHVVKTRSRSARRITDF